MNKQNIFIGVGLVALGVGAYFLITSNNENSESDIFVLSDKVSESMAVIQDSSKISLVNGVDGSVLDTMDLKSLISVDEGLIDEDLSQVEDFKYFYNEETNDLSVYHKGHFKYIRAVDGKLSLQQVLFDYVEDLEYYIIHEDLVISKVGNEAVVSNISSGDSYKIELPDNTYDFRVYNNDLIALHRGELSKIDLEEGNIKDTITVGADMNRMIKNDDTLVVHDSFGEGIGNSLAVNVNLDDFHVEKMSVVNEANSNLLSLKVDNLYFFKNGEEEKNILKLDGDLNKKDKSSTEKVYSMYAVELDDIIYDVNKDGELFLNDRNNIIKHSESDFSGVSLIAPTI